jgi:hypothetical protein
MYPSEGLPDQVIAEADCYGCRLEGSTAIGKKSRHVHQWHHRLRCHPSMTLSRLGYSRHRRRSSCPRGRCGLRLWLMMVSEYCRRRSHRRRVGPRASEVRVPIAGLQVAAARGL